MAFVNSRQIVVGGLVANKCMDSRYRMKMVGIISKLDLEARPTVRLVEPS